MVQVNPLVELLRAESWLSELLRKLFKAVERVCSDVVFHWVIIRNVSRETLSAILSATERGNLRGVERMFESLDPMNCKVALLAGGTSGEREISLSSGKGAQAALEEAGFDVTFLDPANKADLGRLIADDFDVAFLCLHGKGGEDGSIQGLLETIGLPYTGSGVWASALAIDKEKAKMFYRAAGISTPESLAITRDGDYSLEEIAQKMGGSCVVKPNTEGSSLGVFIVKPDDDLEECIDQAFQVGERLLIERYVEGTELTVAVVGADTPEALPIIEIVPQSDSYDFESKYAPGGSQHICPARLDEAVARRIGDLAVRAHQALGCFGVSRSDFLLDADGEPWILETNTIPGMTETSLLPDAARAAGVSFPELCTNLVKYALGAAR